ncbi:hypothetical protein CBS14141_003027 [Malassezia furfur]|nr:hypothetical protein CBS14141_003027 [Malassezia furfur]
MLKGLNLVGCEVVEVSPPYDSNGEVTALAAAELLYEMMSIMALRPFDKKAIDPYERPPRWELKSKENKGVKGCGCDHSSAPAASSSMPKYVFLSLLLVVPAVLFVLKRDSPKPEHQK